MRYGQNNLTADPKSILFNQDQSKPNFNDLTEKEIREFTFKDKAGVDRNLTEQQVQDIVRHKNEFGDILSPFQFRDIGSSFNSDIVSFSENFRYDIGTNKPADKTANKIDPIDLQNIEPTQIPQDQQINALEQLPNDVTFPDKEPAKPDPSLDYNNPKKQKTLNYTYASLLGITKEQANKSGFGLTWKSYEDSWAEDKPLIDEYNKKIVEQGGQPITQEDYANQWNIDYEVIVNNRKLANQNKNHRFVDPITLAKQRTSKISKIGLPGDPFIMGMSSDLYRKEKPEYNPESFNNIVSQLNERGFNSLTDEQWAEKANVYIDTDDKENPIKNLRPVQFNDNFGNRYIIDKDGNKKILALQRSGLSNFRPMWHAVDSDAHIGSEITRSIYGPKGKNSDAWENFTTGFWNTTLDITAGTTGTIAEYLGSWNDYIFGSEGEKGALTKWGIQTQNWTNVSKSKMSEEADMLRISDFSLDAIAKTSGEVLPQILSMLAVGAIAGPGMSRVTGALQSMHYFNQEAVNAGIPDDDRLNMALTAGLITYAAERILGAMGADELIANTFRSPSKVAAARQQFREGVLDVIEKTSMMNPNLSTQQKNKKMAGWVTGLWQKIFSQNNLNRKINIPKGSKPGLLKSGFNAFTKYVIPAAVEEGSEEVIDYVGQTILKEIYDRNFAGIEAIPGYGKFGAEFSMQDMYESFLAGSLGGMYGGAISSVFNKQTDLTGNAIADLAANDTVENNLAFLDGLAAEGIFDNPFVNSDNELIEMSDDKTSQNDLRYDAIRQNLLLAHDARTILENRNIKDANAFAALLGGDDALVSEAISLMRNNDELNVAYKEIERKLQDTEIDDATRQMLEMNKSNIEDVLKNTESRLNYITSGKLHAEYKMSLLTNRTFIPQEGFSSIKDFNNMLEQAVNDNKTENRINAYNKVRELVDNKTLSEAELNELQQKLNNEQTFINQISNDETIKTLYKRFEATNNINEATEIQNEIKKYLLDNNLSLIEGTAEANMFSEQNKRFNPFIEPDYKYSDKANEAIDNNNSNQEIANYLSNKKDFFKNMANELAGKGLGNSNTIQTTQSFLDEAQQNALKDLVEINNELANYETNGLNKVGAEELLELVQSEETIEQFADNVIEVLQRDALPNIETRALETGRVNENNQVVSDQTLKNIYNKEVLSTILPGEKIGYDLLKNLLTDKLNAKTFAPEDLDVISLVINELRKKAATYYQANMLKNAYESKSFTNTEALEALGVDAYKMLGLDNLVDINILQELENKLDEFVAFKSDAQKSLLDLNSKFEKEVREQVKIKVDIINELANTISNNKKIFDQEVSINVKQKDGSTSTKTIKFSKLANRLQKDQDFDQGDINDYLADVAEFEHAMYHFAYQNPEITKSILSTYIAKERKAIINLLDSGAQTSAVKNSLNNYKYNKDDLTYENYKLPPSPNFNVRTLYIVNYLKQIFKAPTSDTYRFVYDYIKSNPDRVGALTPEQEFALFSNTAQTIYSNKSDLERNNIDQFIEIISSAIPLKRIVRNDFVDRDAELDSNTFEKIASLDQIFRLNPGNAGTGKTFSIEYTLFNELQSDTTGNRQYILLSQSQAQVDKLIKTATKLGMNEKNLQSFRFDQFFANLDTESNLENTTIVLDEFSLLKLEDQTKLIKLGHKNRENKNSIFAYGDESQMPNTDVIDATSDMNTQINDMYIPNIRLAQIMRTGFQSHAQIQTFFRTAISGNRDQNIFEFDTQYYIDENKNRGTRIFDNYDDLERFAVQNIKNDNTLLITFDEEQKNRIIQEYGLTDTEDQNRIKSITDSENGPQGNEWDEVYVLIDQESETVQEVISRTESFLHKSLLTSASRAENFLAMYLPAADANTIFKGRMTYINPTKYSKQAEKLEDVERFELDTEFYDNQKVREEKKYEAINKRLQGYQDSFVVPEGKKDEVKEEGQVSAKGKIDNEIEENESENVDDDSGEEVGSETDIEKDSIIDSEGDQYTVGDSIFYNGDSYIITAVNPNGTVKLSQFEGNNITSSINGVNVDNLSNEKTTKTEDVNDDDPVTKSAVDIDEDEGILSNKNLSKIPLYNNHYVFELRENATTVDASSYFSYKNALVKAIIKNGIVLDGTNSNFTIETSFTKLPNGTITQSKFLNLYYKYTEDLENIDADFRKASNAITPILTKKESFDGTYFIVGSFNIDHYLADSNNIDLSELASKLDEYPDGVVKLDHKIQINTKNQFYLQFSKTRGNGKSVNDILEFVENSGGKVIRRPDGQIQYTQRDVKIPGKDAKSVETVMQVAYDKNPNAKLSTIEVVSPLISELNDRIEDFNLLDSIGLTNIDAIMQFFSYNNKPIQLAQNKNKHSDALQGLRFNKDGSLASGIDSDLLLSSYEYILDNADTIDVRVPTLKADNGTVFFAVEGLDRYIKTSVNLLSPTIGISDSSTSYFAVDLDDNVDLNDFFPKGETTESINKLANEYIPGYVKTVGGIDFHDPIKLANGLVALGYTKGYRIGVAALADGRASIKTFFHEFGHFIKDNLLSNQAKALIEQEVRDKYENVVNPDEKIMELYSEYAYERNKLKGFSSAFRSVLDWMKNIANNIKGLVGLKSELDALFYDMYTKKYSDQIEYFFENIDDQVDEDTPIKYSRQRYNNERAGLKNILGKYNDRFFQKFSNKMYEFFVSPKVDLQNFDVRENSTDIIDAIDRLEYSFREPILFEFLQSEYDKQLEDENYEPKIKLAGNANPNLIPNLNNVEVLEYRLKDGTYESRTKNNQGRFFSDSRLNRSNNRDLLARFAQNFKIDKIDPINGQPTGEKITYRQLIALARNGVRLVDQMSQSNFERFTNFLMLKDGYLFSQIKSFFPNVNLGNSTQRGGGVFYSEQYESLEQSSAYTNTSTVANNQQYKDNSEVSYTDKQSTIAKLVINNIPMLKYDAETNQVVNETRRTFNTVSQLGVTSSIAADVPSYLIGKTLNNIVIDFYKNNFINDIVTNDDLIRYQQILKQYLIDNNVIDTSGNFKTENGDIYNQNETLKYLYSFYQELFSEDSVSHFSLYKLQNRILQDVNQGIPIDINRAYNAYSALNPETKVSRDNLEEYLSKSHSFASSILSSMLLHSKNVTKKNLLQLELFGKEGNPSVKKIVSDNQVRFAGDLKDAMDSFLHTNEMPNKIATRFLLFGNSPFAKLSEEEAKKPGLDYIGKDSMKAIFQFDGRKIQYNDQTFVTFNNNNIQINTEAEGINYDQLIKDYFRYLGIKPRYSKIRIAPIVKTLSNNISVQGEETPRKKTLDFIVTNLMASHIQVASEAKELASELGIEGLSTALVKPYDTYLRNYLNIQADNNYGKGSILEDENTNVFKPTELNTQIDFIAEPLQRSYGGIQKEFATIGNKKIYINQTSRNLDDLVEVIGRKAFEAGERATGFIKNNPLVKFVDFLTNKSFDFYDMQLSKSKQYFSDVSAKRMTEREHFYATQKMYFANLKNVSDRRSKRNLIPVHNHADRTPIYMDADMRFYTDPTKRSKSNGFIIRDERTVDGKTESFYYLDNRNILNLALDRVNMQNSLQVKSINKWSTILDGIQAIEDVDVRSFDNLTSYRDYIKSVRDTKNLIASKLELYNTQEKVQELLDKDTDLILQPSVDYALFTDVDGNQRILLGFDTSNFQTLSLPNSDKFLQSPINFNENLLQTIVTLSKEDFTKLAENKPAEKSILDSLKLTNEDVIFMLAKVKSGENILNESEETALKNLVGDYNSDTKLQRYVIDTLYGKELNNLHRKAESNNFVIDKTIPGVSIANNRAGIKQSIGEKFVTNSVIASLGISYDLSNFFVQHITRGSYANFTNTNFSETDFIVQTADNLNKRSKIESSPGMRSVKTYYGEDKKLNIITFEDVEITGFTTFNSKTGENELTTQNGTDGYTLINPLQQRMQYNGLSGQAGVTPLQGTFKTVGGDLNYESGEYITLKHNEFTLSYDDIQYAPENERILELMLDPLGTNGLYTAYRNIFRELILAGQEPSLAFESALDQIYEAYIARRGDYTIIHKIPRKSSRKEESQHKTTTLAEFAEMEPADRLKHFQQIDSDNFRFVLNQDDVQGNNKQQDFVQILRIILASNTNDVSKKLVNDIKNKFSNVFDLETKRLIHFFKGRGPKLSIAEIHKGLDKLETANQIANDSNFTGLQSLVNEIAKSGMVSTQSNSLLNTLITENQASSNDIAGVRTRVVQYLKARVRNRLIKFNRTGSRLTTKPAYNYKIYEYNTADEQGNIKTRYFSKAEAERYKVIFGDGLPNLDDVTKLETEDQLNEYQTNRSEYLDKFVEKELDNYRYLEGREEAGPVKSQTITAPTVYNNHGIPSNISLNDILYVYKEVVEDGIETAEEIDFRDFVGDTDALETKISELLNGLYDLQEDIEVIDNRSYGRLNLIPKENPKYAINNRFWNWIELKLRNQVTQKLNQRFSNLSARLDDQLLSNILKEEKAQAVQNISTEIRKAIFGVINSLDSFSVRTPSGPGSGNPTNIVGFARNSGSVLNINPKDFVITGEDADGDQKTLYWKSETDKIIGNPIQTETTEDLLNSIFDDIQNIYNSFENKSLFTTKSGVEDFKVKTRKEYTPLGLSHNSQQFEDSHKGDVGIYASLQKAYTTLISAQNANEDLDIISDNIDMGDGTFLNIKNDAKEDSNTTLQNRESLMNIVLDLIKNSGVQIGIDKRTNMFIATAVNHINLIQEHFAQTNRPIVQEVGDAEPIYVKALKRITNTAAFKEVIDKIKNDSFNHSSDRPKTIMQQALYYYDNNIKNKEKSQATIDTARNRISLSISNLQETIAKFNLDDPKFKKYINAVNEMLTDMSNVEELTFTKAVDASKKIRRIRISPEEVTFTQENFKSIVNQNMSDIFRDLQIVSRNNLKLNENYNRDLFFVAKLGMIAQINSDLTTLADINQYKYTSNKNLLDFIDNLEKVTGFEYNDVLSLIEEYSNAIIQNPNIQLSEFLDQSTRYQNGLENQIELFKNKNKNKNAQNFYSYLTETYVRPSFKLENLPVVAEEKINFTDQYYKTYNAMAMILSDRILSNQIKAVALDKSIETAIHAVTSPAVRNIMEKVKSYAGIDQMSETKFNNLQKQFERYFLSEGVRNVGSKVLNSAFDNINSHIKEVSRKEFDQGDLDVSKFSVEGNRKLPVKLDNVYDIAKFNALFPDYFENKIKRYLQLTGQNIYANNQFLLSFLVETRGNQKYITVNNSISDSQKSILREDYRQLPVPVQQLIGLYVVTSEQKGALQDIVSAEGIKEVLNHIDKIKNKLNSKLFSNKGEAEFEDALKQILASDQSVLKQQQTFKKQGVTYRVPPVSESGYAKYFEGVTTTSKTFSGKTFIDRITTLFISDNTGYGYSRSKTSAGIDVSNSLAAKSQKNLLSLFYAPSDITGVSKFSKHQLIDKGHILTELEFGDYTGSQVLDYIKNNIKLEKNNDLIASVIENEDFNIPVDKKIEKDELSDKQIISIKSRIKDSTLDRASLKYGSKLHNAELAINLGVTSLNAEGTLSKDSKKSKSILAKKYKDLIYQNILDNKGVFLQSMNDFKMFIDYTSKYNSSNSAALYSYFANKFVSLQEQNALKDNPAELSFSQLNTVEDYEKYEEEGEVEEGLLNTRFDTGFTQTALINIFGNTGLPFSNDINHTIIDHNFDLQKKITSAIKTLARKYSVKGILKDIDGFQKYLNETSFDYVVKKYSKQADIDYKKNLSDFNKGKFKSNKNFKNFIDDLLSYTDASGKILLDAENDYITKKQYSLPYLNQDVIEKHLANYGTGSLVKAKVTKKIDFESGDIVYTRDGFVGLINNFNRKDGIIEYKILRSLTKQPNVLSSKTILDDIIQDSNNKNATAQIVKTLKTAFPGLDVSIINQKMADNLGYGQDNSFIKDGKIFVNIDKATKGVALHEFAHPFVALLEDENPDLFNQLAIDLRNTPLFEKVEKVYHNTIRSNTNTAQEYERYLNHELITNFLQNLVDSGKYRKPKRKFFDWFKGFLRRIFGLPQKSNIDNLDLFKASSLDIGNAIIADMLSGNKISNITSPQISRMLPGYMPSKISTEGFEVNNLEYLSISEEFDNKERVLKDKIKKQIKTSIERNQVFKGISGRYDLRNEAQNPGIKTKKFYEKGVFSKAKQDKEIAKVLDKESQASKKVHENFFKFLSGWKYSLSSTKDIYDAVRTTYLKYLSDKASEEDKAEVRNNVQRDLLDKLNFNRHTDEVVLLNGKNKKELQNIGIKYEDIEKFVDKVNPPLMIVYNYYPYSKDTFSPDNKKKIKIFNVSNTNITAKNFFESENGDITEGRSKFGSNLLTKEELQPNDLQTTYSDIQSIKNTLLSLKLKEINPELIIESVGSVQIGNKNRVHQRFIKDILPQIDRVLKHKKVYESLSEEIKNILVSDVNNTTKFELDPIELVKFYMNNYEIDKNVNKNAQQFHSKTYQNIHELITQYNDVNDGSIKKRILDVVNKRMQYLKNINPDRYHVDDEYYALGSIYMKMSEDKINPKDDIKEMTKVGYSSKTYTLLETMDRVGEEVKSFLVNEINNASLKSSMELESITTNTEEQVIKLNAALGNVLGKGIEKSKELFEKVFIYEDVIDNKTNKKTRINTFTLHWDKNAPVTRKALNNREITEAHVEFGKYVMDAIEKEFVDYEFQMSYQKLRNEIKNYKDLPKDELDAQVYERAKELVSKKWNKGMLPVVTRQASEALSQGDVKRAAGLFFDNVNKVESPYEIYYESDDNTSPRNITSHFFSQFTETYRDDHGSTHRKQMLGLAVSNSSDATTLVNENKQKELSYNLQLITNYVIASSIRSRNYKDAVTAYHVAQDQYLYLQNKKGIDTSNLLKQIENYSQKTIFGRLPEFDKLKLLGNVSVDLNKFSHGASTVVSSVALAMSPILATKNVAAAAAKAYANAFAFQMSGMDFFDIPTLTKAFSELFSNPQKVTSLNRKYVFAAMSERELLNSFLYNKTKANLADGDTQFFMYQYGDKYMNLVSSLAQMIYDGTYDAHDQNGNYDYTKDKRFKAKYDVNGNVTGYENSITKEGKMLIESIKSRNTFRGMFGQKADNDLQSAYTDQDIGRIQAANQRYVTEITDSKFKNQISTFGVARMIMTLKNYLNAYTMMWFKPTGYETVMGKRKVVDNEVVWDPLFNEGIVYTFANTMKLVRKHGIDGFSKLQPAQKKNLFKFASHLGIYAAINTIISALGFDEEERKLDKKFDDGTADLFEDGFSYLFAKIAMGANQELFGQINPLELLKLVYAENGRSNIPLVGFVQNIGRQLMSTSALMSTVFLDPSQRIELADRLKESWAKDMVSKDITIFESLRKWVQNSGSIIPIAGAIMRDVNNFFDSFLDKIVEESEKEYLLTAEGIDFKLTQKKLRKKKKMDKKDYRIKYILDSFSFDEMPENYREELDKLQREVNRDKIKIQRLERDEDQGKEGFGETDDSFMEGLLY